LHSFVQTTVKQIFIFTFQTVREKIFNDFTQNACTPGIVNIMKEKDSTLYDYSIAVLVQIIMQTPYPQLLQRVVFGKELCEIISLFIEKFTQQFDSNNTYWKWLYGAFSSLAPFDKNVPPEVETFMDRLEKVTHILIIY